MAAIPGHILAIEIKHPWFKLFILVVTGILDWGHHESPQKSQRQDSGLLILQHSTEQFFKIHLADLG